MTSASKGSGSGKESPEPEPAEEHVKVTDKRLIDPETGEPRAAAVPQPANEPRAQDTDDERVAELTADLQRVTAEYANYRKRVDRDREVVNELAIIAVLSEMLPILDDIDLARRNNDLEGPFRLVAEAIDSLVAKLGMERFGASGEEFDPAIHEALTHSLRDDIAEGEEVPAGDGPVCVEIYQPGYRIKDRIVRPARVAVVE